MKIVVNDSRKLTRALASPLSSGSLLVGKALANAAMMLAIELVGLAVFGVFYNSRWWLRSWELAATCVAATWGVSIIGAVFGALTVNLRLRELMLPVIVYPLLIPLLIAAIELTNTITPSFLAIICGRTAWLMNQALLTLRHMISS